MSEEDKGQGMIVKDKVETKPIPKSYRRKKSRSKKRNVVKVPLTDLVEGDKEDSNNETEQPIKLYSFRSQDKSLRLIWKSSYTRKEKGETEFFPSEGVQFNDWQLFIEDTPKNKEVLDKLLNHPSKDIKFKLEPDETLMAETTTEIIGKMEKMSEEELRERCHKSGITREPGMSKEKMIIELMKVLTK